MNNVVKNTLTELQMRLLDEYQRGFPLSPAPFAELAAELDVDERTVIDTLRGLQASGYISRIGPVIRPHTVGVSTLVAMAVPEARLQQVADIVSDYVEVNHNYRREHRFNLWFVITAPEDDALRQVLVEIEARSGLQCMSLPMLEDYFIDLGFPLQ